MSPSLPSSYLTYANLTIMEWDRVCLPCSKTGGAPYSPIITSIIEDTTDLTAIPNGAKVHVRRFKSSKWTGFYEGIVRGHLCAIDQNATVRRGYFVSVGGGSDTRTGLFFHCLGEIDDSDRPANQRIQVGSPVARPLPGPLQGHVYAAVMTPKMIQPGRGEAIVWTPALLLPRVPDSGFHRSSYKLLQGIWKDSIVDGDDIQILPYAHETFRALQMNGENALPWEPLLNDH